MPVIVKGLGKGESVRVVGRSPYWVEVVVVTGRFAGREWTLNPGDLSEG